MSDRITINNLVSIPNILFNFFSKFAANYGSLSDITLSGNLCNFHILFLNNLANPSTDISSIITIKYAILDNLLYITKINYILPFY